MARLRAAAAATAAVVGLIAAAVKAGAVAWLLRLRAVVLLAKSAWNMSLGSVLEPWKDIFHELGLGVEVRIFIPVGRSNKRCWWDLRYCNGVWQVKTAREATSRERRGMLLRKKGRTNGLKGKLVTSWRTWMKSVRVIVPAWKKMRKKTNQAVFATERKLITNSRAQKKLAVQGSLPGSEGVEHIAKMGPEAKYMSAQGNRAAAGGAMWN